MNVANDGQIVPSVKNMHLQLLIVPCLLKCMCRLVSVQDSQSPLVTLVSYIGHVRL